MMTPDYIQRRSLYLDLAMLRCKFKNLDGRVFASLPTHPGVWAIAATPHAAEIELREVLMEWCDLGHGDIPTVQGISWEPLTGRKT